MKTKFNWKLAIGAVGLVLISGVALAQSENVLFSRAQLAF